MTEKRPFGSFGGAEVSAYTLSAGDLAVTVSDLGATILSVKLKLKSGEVRDLVRGYDDIDSYLNAEGYLGAVVGRVGNRICRGKFTLDGKDYSLFVNNGANHLHGGKCGFDKKVYSLADISDGDEPSITFVSSSPDMEEGYPGQLDWSVKYTLTSKGGLRIDYRAVCDAPTPVNLTNHVYFNLDGCGTVAEHTLVMDADRYLPTDETMIPTGEIKPVDGTAFDYRTAKTLGEGMNSSERDVEIGGGLDHCMVFTDGKRGFVERARVTGGKGDAELTLFTDRPCVQLYTGNFLGDPKFPFRGGEPQVKRAAFCLETQIMPDAVNHPNFTNSVLRPGEVLETSTEFRFAAL